MDFTCTSKPQSMYNFASGPAMLPVEVLDQARNEIPDWSGSGMSVMEMPFTCDEFQSIAEQAKTDLKKLLKLPENYHVLFLQGGAYAHFSILAMNLLGKNRQADYVQTGHWSGRAIQEARRYGEITVAISTEDSGYRDIPSQSSWQLNETAAYCHYTSNETANGVQFKWIPETGDVPLVSDMTSDFLAHRLDASRFGMIYASAQKNIGIAGLTVIIIRDDLLDQSMDITPTVFCYAKQAENNSRVNTQPTFSLYTAGLVFKWLLDNGGLEKVENLNRKKANLLYSTIDNCHLYQCPVSQADRSQVNVCFKLKDSTLQEQFLSSAKHHGLLNLNGHNATGGLRASLYNAMPLSGVKALTGFMQDFASHHDY